MASAHIIPGTAHGLREGFVHPFTGMDHLLAMFAVGMWAAQHRGRAMWMIPLTFVGVMGLGGAIGLAGAALPGAAVEIGIACSVLVLGALIATSAQFKLSWSMCLVGLFALFHGYAHGHEMPAAMSAATFSAGFMAATLLLHGLGIAVGLGLKRQDRLVRVMGAGIALCSVCLFAGLN